MRYSLLFCALLMALPLRGYAALPFGPFGIRLDWLIAAFMGSLFVAEMFVEGRVITPGAVARLALLHVALIASVWIPLRSGSATRVMDWATTYGQYVLGTMALLPLINLRISGASLDRVLRVYWGVAALAAALGVTQFLGSGVGLDLHLKFINPAMVDAHSGYQAVTGSFSRATGFFEEPRQFGNYLVSGFALSLVGLSVGYTPFRSRLTLRLIATLLAVGIVVSLSVSAIIIAAVALAFTVFILLRSRFQLGRRLRLRYVSVVILVALFTASILLLSGNDTVAFVRTRLTIPDVGMLLRQVGTLDVGRYGWFRYAGQVGLSLQLLGISPFVGIGLNNLPHYGFDTFTGAFGFWRQLAETGLLGTGALIALLIYPIRWGRATRRRVLSSGHTDPRLSAIQMMIPLVVGILVLKSFATGLYGFSGMFFWSDLALGFLLLSHARIACAAPGGEKLYNPESNRTALLAGPAEDAHMGSPS